MAWGFESPPAHHLRSTEKTMAVQVDTLDKLERRTPLPLRTEAITSEVESRLRRLSRTVRADGFRPGKVPMSVVAQRYGWPVQDEGMNDKVGKGLTRGAPAT